MRAFPPPPMPAPHALPPCTCGRLRRAARALTQMYDDEMAPAGLRVTQFSLLRTLAREGPVRLTALAAAAMLDRTALARNLDPLVTRGLVAIAPGRDARTRVAALTGRGRAALAGAEPHWRRAQARVRRRLGGERVDALVATLAALEALHPDAAARTA
jgi:DNA-binding MarR family transcriptional regulator